MTEAPQVAVWMVSGYALVLLVVAWLVDRMGARSSQRSAAWRTGNFVYHEKNDAWRCHQDQWLYPAAFDPEKRVIRYQGQHAICGRCPAKESCSPTPGPREITKAVDPWPHSEAGRFHRGIALAIAVIAFFLPALGLLTAHGWTDVVVLLTVLVVVAAAGYPLARHLWQSPANFPEHLPTEGMEQTARTHQIRSAAPSAPGVPVRGEVDAMIDRYATRWGMGDKRVPAKDADEPKQTNERGGVR